MQLYVIKFITLMLGAILLYGCSCFNKKENLTSMSLLPKVENHFEPKIIWSYSSGLGHGNIYPIVQFAWQDNRIFITDHKGTIKAIDVNSGKELWSTNLFVKKGFFSQNDLTNLSGGLAATASRLYVASELAKVYSLDAKNGTIIWETDIIGEGLSRPVISNNIVVIHTNNGILQGLNEKNGLVKWTVSLDVPLLKLRGASTPAIAYGAAIIGSDNGSISAVMINKGHLIWQRNISPINSSVETSHINTVKTTPIIINGVIYTLTHDNNFSAIDLYSGQIIWSREIGPLTNFLIENNRIYVMDKNDYITALNVENGKTLWCQKALLNRKLTPPTMYRDYIITGDAEGYLYWLHNKDGQFISKKKLNSTGLISTSIVAGNKLIIQARNGNIYAINA
ncbi:outer membrane assembly lipoprotein YfgL [secondary endosymbiont of Heteropsylla cubana]|uniref:Outer membrane protein assembly factor BamB n=1 Tax=secondary endosymbiont of Heteropsylla cubana TaxID=134287 RepID=J3Z5W2_9ENTR|nr:outer membrane protein assembly factor BamB [secondary endosymbiont of Heteropsylla cubana]AFP85754.1 outer membrane assembly lipoprotein YfgL [secondary endosymbiont of Heteropsylla cubana]